MRYGNRKKNYRRRPRKNKDTYVTKKQVNSLISRRIENKFYPLYQKTTVDTAGYLQSLSNIGQGDTAMTRTGDDIHFVRYQMTAEIFNQADVHNTMRIIIFQWRPDDAIDAPTVAKLLDNISSSAVYPTHYQYNYVTRTKYNVLYDKSFVLMPTYAFNSSGVVTSGVSRAAVNTFKVNIDTRRKLNKIIRFNEGLNSGKNKLYMLVVSDSILATHPTIAYSANIFFEDG